MSNNINVYTYGREYSTMAMDAAFIGGSKTYDIALIKVTNNTWLKSGGQNFIAAAEIADSDKIYPGQRAVAVGNPLGFLLSVTEGVISKVSDIMALKSLENIYQDQEHRVIRIDTAVNSGNSGGGLFDSQGRLIGIVSAKNAGSDVDNIGYAIPSNIAIGVAENIIANGTGTIRKLVLDMTPGIISADPVYANGKITITNVVGIAEVKAYGKGQQAGFWVNDILVSAAITRGGVTTTIAITQLHTLTDFLFKIQAGDTLKITIKRGGVNAAPEDKIINVQSGDLITIS